MIEQGAAAYSILPVLFFFFFQSQLVQTALALNKIGICHNAINPGTVVVHRTEGSARNLVDVTLANFGSATMLRAVKGRIVLSSGTGF